MTAVVQMGVLRLLALIRKSVNEITYKQLYMHFQAFAVVLYWSYSSYRTENSFSG